MALTDRKKKGLAMVVGHGCGVIVGMIVFWTTSTPVIVPILIGTVISIATNYIGIAITTPEIPE